MQTTSILAQNRFPLHGAWKRSVSGRAIDYVPVPGSYTTIGECTLEFTFSTPWADTGTDRIFLCTEGVISSAEFTLNGKVLGIAGPWVPYRFEIPTSLLQANNTITARVRDLLERFGPMPGRRNDGGLVRDLYLERRPKAFIETFTFRTVLTESCDAADCTVQAEINGVTKSPVSVSLVERDTQRVVAQVQAPAGQPITFQVPNPRLWSPELPNLYTISVRLDGKEPDEVQDLVGFRRIEVRGQDFFLNNKRLLLKGICRHEFTSRHGYCPPLDEVRRELALIRHSGFNYVRLVHSPQAACVPRLAAELGLLVSEEPGTCWHDLDDPTLSEPAFETLRRTVLRDRNVPSILAWHIYNECAPNVAFAKRTAALCRELDPGALLSFADCTGQDDKVKEMVAAANLSYYGVNQYSIFGGDYWNRMKKYTDKPLLFTEWGGCLLQGNPRQLQEVIDTFVRHAQPNATPRVAGCTFWAWADYEEYSRGGPAAPDGWTVEGLLDERAKPRIDLQMLSMMCYNMDYPEPIHLPKVEILTRMAQRKEAWQPVPLDAVAGDQAPLEAEVAKLRSKFQFRMPAAGLQIVAGIPFAMRGTDGLAPLLLGAGREELVIPVNRKIRGIAVLGHVAMSCGQNCLKGVYPSAGYWADMKRTLGQEASHYDFVFEDGTVGQPLQHGIQILRSNNINSWWKMAPRAPETTPGLQVELNPAFEVMRFDVWEQTFDKPRVLREIRWRLTDPTSIQALLALSVW